MVEIRGGAKFEKRLAEISASLKKVGSVKIGFLRNARYPDGTQVALIAAIQNYGAPRAGIPPRPFFSNMVVAKSKEWPEDIAKLLALTNYDTKRVLSLMGEKVKGQLQQSIRDTNTPPLKPATVRRKGFAKPLVDTGHMLNSVAYELNVR